MLPVHTLEEKKLFNRLVTKFWNAQYPHTSTWIDFAKEWNAFHANGEITFYK
jgi:hypothetical protein